MNIQAAEDVVRVRQLVRARAVAVGFSLVDQTKIITAASEIARNTVDYGGGGKVVIDDVRSGVRKGLRLVFSDEGPGIPDVQRALQDGYTTGSGLGLGLSGAKRLSSEFDIKSAPGAGTTITLIRWK
ncbi:MAG TPA: anti-sigma regulatory factor [Alphaproteobacteria bacterium]|nr:anti-sigma regulatory factor [Alphaproteobacteria bacterium]